MNAKLREQLIGLYTDQATDMTALIRPLGLDIGEFQKAFTLWSLLRQTSTTGVERRNMAVLFGMIDSSIGYDRFDTICQQARKKLMDAPVGSMYLVMNRSNGHNYPVGEIATRRNIRDNGDGCEAIYKSGFGNMLAFTNVAFPTLEQVMQFLDVDLELDDDELTCLAQVTNETLNEWF